ncbi:MAG TPA: hypothetical protein VM367_01255 [Pseudonocardia sp.]|nr:hypothetical protein [Pseudonocardia sp.]
MRVDPAVRLELARGLLRRAEDGSATQPSAGTGPVSGARTVPVAPPLAGLLPAGALRRGSTVAVREAPGATSLLFGLLAGASVDGAWIGLVGRPGLGLVAAAEAGIRLDRLALVPYPGRDLVAVTAALLDGLDLVAVAGAERAVRAADRRRLEARARQRAAVLMPLGAWPGADVELVCGDPRWEGLDAGAGRLRTRSVRVDARGHGLGPAGRSARLLLPASGGGLAPAGDGAGEQGIVEHTPREHGARKHGAGKRSGDGERAAVVGPEDAFEAAAVPFRVAG